MFENRCSLPLRAELFAQAVHPAEPLLAVGLASGHVECFRLDDDADDGGDGGGGASGRSTIASLWRTRRHKGSCRTLAFADDGSGGFCLAASVPRGLPR